MGGSLALLWEVRGSLVGGSASPRLISSGDRKCTEGNSPHCPGHVSGQSGEILRAVFTQDRGTDKTDYVKKNLSGRKNYSQDSPPTKCAFAYINYLTACIPWPVRVVFHCFEGFFHRKFLHKLSVCLSVLGCNIILYKKDKGFNRA